MVGTVTISIELELGWGSHDLQEYDHLSADGRAEFDALSAFLKTLDNYRIPITFDIVGHLLHEGCTGQHGGPYPDEWWKEDPGTDQETDPLFYAPAFVDAIREASMEHEIGTHTYSHVLCNQTSDAVLNHELSVVEDLHSRTGLEQPRSLVTPRNQPPNPEILTDHGIETLRVVSNELPDWMNQMGKIGTFVWHLFGYHPIADLEVSDGLVKTPCTPTPSLTTPTLPAGQLPPHPAFQTIPRLVRRKLHRRHLRSTIDRVEATNGHVHLWTHVYNMTNRDQLSVVRSGLEYLADRRDAGGVQVLRMCELPEVVSA